MSAAAQQADLGQCSRRMRPTGGIQLWSLVAAQQACLQPWRLQRLAFRRDNPLQIPAQKKGNRHEDDRGPLMRSGRTQVVLLERGQAVEQRGRDIGALFARGIINPDSNLCYGQTRLDLTLVVTFTAAWSMLSAAAQD